MADLDSPGELPTIFPIFPLPNVVHFPGTYLPLHIFEPRYRAMLDRTAEGDRVIGMILLRPGADASLARAPIFSVGCAGRIAESARLSDGRWNLLLLGERRFRIARELELVDGYREVEAELLPEPSFAELPADARVKLERQRAELETRMLELVRLTSPDGAAALGERMRALDPVLLVSALSFGLDCPVLEKQSLLETDGAFARGELLLRVLAFRIAEARLPDAPKIVN
jgi:hypothetical protein